MKRLLVRLLAGVAVVAAAIAAAVPLSASASPRTASTSRALQGVACVSARSCWAVGAATTGTTTRTLIEHWNGSKWSVVASPSVRSSSGTFLKEVSCTGPSDCWAVGRAVVGTTKQEPIAEHWNGRRWSLIVLPEPAGRLADELRGVSCLTATRCWAVGFSERVAFSPALPLAEHWTGKRWFVVRTAKIAIFTGLDAVSCRQDTNCWAVGFGPVGTLAEHWNGRKWSIVVTPRGTGGALGGVSCPGSDCLAVGNDGSESALAERWNGARWSVTPVPSLSKGGSVISVLFGVSCVSSSDCFGVGYVAVVRPATLVLRWQGSKWVLVKSPNPAGSADAQLQAASCVSERACWAVGSQARTGSGGRTLAEHWNGRSWSIVGTP
jgi:hypothetical protein